MKSLAPKARFFQADVTKTESIAAAVKGSVEWAEQTGKPLGGVLPIAGISTPALVSRLPIERYYNQRPIVLLINKSVMYGV